MLADVIGAQIRIRRKARGLSQAELSNRLGISNQGCISLWESGQFAPGAFSLCVLADFFGCSVDELLGRNENA